MGVTISVLNQKGGSGKTTLATNIASGLARAGGKVLLVDSDPQGSARDWRAANENSPIPVIGLDRPTLANDLKDFSQQYDIVVIDGAPQLKDLAASAIRVSDAILIPVQPSPYDIWATADLVELIKARQEITDGRTQAAFLVSRAIQNTRLSSEVIEALKHYSLPVFKSMTYQRVVYAVSASNGLSVYDAEDEKAKHEMQYIVEELMQWVN
ncbi:MAG: ParA family partition ATPase [Pseudomonadota bacterium]|nr:ParA family partition ATPase [Pseudomonadota bacterium]